MPISHIHCPYGCECAGNLNCCGLFSVVSMCCCSFFLKFNRRRACPSCALSLPGMAWTRSPQSTTNLGLGRSWFTASTACFVSSTSSAHSSPPPSQSPSLHAFIRPSWGSAAWMKKNGPVHSCSASGTARGKNGLSSREGRWLLPRPQYNKTD